ncbi:cytochrome c biogenesis protein DipZ [Candidatus Gracilibacteria bacterium]|nr:cytochrome c biogenesis protein DipZ [Candidatus Gracilibacteria bacterium]
MFSLSLALVSLIAGVLTILAPCVLPVLPVILAGSVGEKGKWYPYIVTGSLALSIVAFTVLLKASTLLIDVPPEFWKYLSGVILLALGLVYIFPHTWTLISSRIFGSRANSSLDHAQDIESSTMRAIVTGAVLGPVFSTCSPTYSLLLATVFPVSLVAGIVYTFIYAIGLSLVLLAIAVFGASLVRKLKVFADEGGIFRKMLGLILVVVGLLIITGIDKKIETYLVTHFDVTSIEESVLDRVLPSTSPSAPISPIPEQILPSSESQIQNIPKLNIENPIAAPEIPGSLTNWINSNPLTMASLKGKVVLIDFWTYSCINCQRTLPYLIDWDKKYRDQGLVIIGVHAPEFAFEKVKNNVEKAVTEAQIRYPVVLDNDFTLWNLYNNRYWPAKYFIDRSGKIRHTHFGEGEYAESETVIQYLLNEGKIGSEVAMQSPRLSSQEQTKSIPQQANTKPQSPETYLGTDRRANIVVSDAPLASNQWSLGGKWDEQLQSITAVKQSTLSYNFSARDVYLVLGGTGTIKVTVDGIVQNPGKDVQNGIITVDSDRMYHIVHSPHFAQDKILKLEFSPGVSAYAFTFGS